ncbi:MAG: bifunctional hydroxymethylpyrimidine kinase/phosphomethylpyrimidine kinase [Sphingomonadales bacterium]|nr:bifunctional hydroxymethylpyrimidine kinase/phosphomethylpyrimidine kinase [Sphingomonadales bacterium]
MVPPRILSIAGSDSSGGAGIQADIKTITVLGGYAMTAITAITAQNTLGVATALVLSPDLIAAQIDACINDIGIDAVKIGMLGSPEIAGIVADRVAAMGVPVVVDPVMIATSGAALADAATIAAFERLMQLATVTTPNVAELDALGGHTGMLARHVAYLAKGGDADGERVEDVLCLPGQPPHIMAGTRIHTRHTHGTGCTLSSAIATYLGLGFELAEAVDRARLYVRSALRAAPGFGQGNGPLGHAAARG